MGGKKTSASGASKKDASRKGAAGQDASRKGAAGQDASRKGAAKQDVSKPGRRTGAPGALPEPSPEAAVAAAARAAPLPVAISVGDRPARPGRVVAHLTPAERTARGRAARTEVPRGSHGEWSPPGNRPDPVAMLREQDRSRVPELAPIRYGRMSASAFAYYRGAAAIMAADLTATPRSGLTAQLCGDAHLSNFGVFAAPDRSLVFDINDFDETLPGPWEWDVKRLAAGVEIAARHRGLDDRTRRNVVLAAVRQYRDAMTEFASQGNLQVWYARLDAQRIVDEWQGIRATVSARKREKGDRLAAGTRRILDKARAKDSLRAFDKLTETVDGVTRIISDPPLVTPLRELVDPRHLAEDGHAVENVLRAYRASLPNDRRRLLESFRVVDAARKVVGIGSVGTRAWIGLLLGRDTDDPLFLQFKEAGESVLEPFAGKTRFANHGRRVVEGQRLMQAAGDVLLGWTRITGLDGVTRDYYVRQLWDGKGSVDLETIGPAGLKVYAELCGWTLARAHARSGDRVAIAAYLGGGDVFPRAIADFSASYADQNARDYARLTAAIESGQVEVQTGT